MTRSYLVHFLRDKDKPQLVLQVEAKDFIELSVKAVNSLKVGQIIKSVAYRELASLRKMRMIKTRLMRMIKMRLIKMKDRRSLHMKRGKSVC